MSENWTFLEPEQFFSVWNPDYFGFQTRTVFNTVENSKKLMHPPPPDEFMARVMIGWKASNDLMIEKSDFKG